VHSSGAASGKTTTVEKEKTVEKTKVVRVESGGAAQASGQAKGSAHAKAHAKAKAKSKSKAHAKGKGKFKFASGKKKGKGIGRAKKPKKPRYRVHGKGKGKARIAMVVNVNVKGELKGKAGKKDKKKKKKGKKAKKGKKGKKGKKKKDGKDEPVEAGDEPETEPETEPEPEVEVIPPPETPPENDFGYDRPVEGCFEGAVVFIEPNSRLLPADYEKYEVESLVYACEWDIPTRSFSSGFPGVEDKFEWFAIRYSGSFYVDTAGTYTFRINSDDGTKLYIDGELVVDNDGIHPPRDKTGTVELQAGDHELVLEYFQGPRYHIALQVFVTPPGGEEGIFSVRE
jgi:hypothetical protein